MYKLKIKILYNEKAKTELLNFKITLTLAKLDMVGSRLVSNGLNVSNDIPLDIQLVTSLLLSNNNELSIAAKTKKF